MTARGGVCDVWFERRFTHTIGDQTMPRSVVATEHARSVVATEHARMFVATEQEVLLPQRMHEPLFATTRACTEFTTPRVVATVCIHVLASTPPPQRALAQSYALDDRRICRRWIFCLDDSGSIGSLETNILLAQFILFTVYQTQLVTTE